MLKIYDAENVNTLHPLNLPDNAWYITHKYDGVDILSFEISPKNEAYPYLSEEVVITDGENNYVVKSIDEHGSVAVFDCEIDLREWRYKFWRQYRRTSVLLVEVLNEIKPSGWIVSGTATFSNRATVEASEGNPLENVVSLDILAKACSVYGCTVNYDTQRKILNVIDVAVYTDTGEYFTDELNLRSIGYTGNSTNFATRLYAYGKKDDDGNPLTFSSINGGKEYVDDFTYSDQVISVGWSDERYTVKENLLAAAKEKLKTLAYPERSYECDVVNLDNNVWMYKQVTLIDRRRKTRVAHRVVEYREYPKKHNLDVITLSSTAPKIQGTIQQIKTDMEYQKVETENHMSNEILSAITSATNLLTGAKGGNFVLNTLDGKPYEVLFMDTDNVNTAKKVWRFNMNGWGYSSNGINGPYKLAATMDGSIVADFITTGTLNANLIKAGVIKGIRIESEDGTFVVDSYGRIDIYPPQEGSNMYSRIRLHMNGDDGYMELGPYGLKRIVGNRVYNYIYKMTSGMASVIGSSAKITLPNDFITNGHIEVIIAPTKIWSYLNSVGTMDISFVIGSNYIEIINNTRSADTNTTVAITVSYMIIERE